VQMLGGLRAPPKTERSAAPARRLEDLARALEESEQPVARARENPDQTSLRRRHPILGIPVRAAERLRRVARCWGARSADGREMPSIGRLRKAAIATRRDEGKMLSALGRWLTANGHAACVKRGVALTPEIVAFLAASRTTCSCATCQAAEPEGQTCELVAVSRASVELYELFMMSAGSPLGQHLRAVVGAIHAIAAIIEQMVDWSPQLEALAARLEETPGQAAQIWMTTEVSPSLGLEVSLVMLRRVREELRTYLNDRCRFNDLSLGDVGATGAGAPVLRRAPAQHLAAGRLAFGRSGRGLTIRGLRNAPRNRSEIADQRTRFIRVRSTG
jgi:hypothetical protein